MMVFSDKAPVAVRDHLKHNGSDTVQVWVLKNKAGNVEETMTL